MVNMKWAKTLIRVIEFACLAGVPFRMMIETYSHPDNARLHAAACQVKVFKLKGADRKHKQDREKILKKTPVEQAKLQPSYECTVFGDVSVQLLYNCSFLECIKSDKKCVCVQCSMTGKETGVKLNVVFSRFHWSL